MESDGGHVGKPSHTNYPLIRFQGIFTLPQGLVFYFWNMPPYENPVAILKNVGLKVTKNREQVISILKEAKRPLNHQEIMERLPQGQSWDRVTIYRALADLEGKHILSTMLNGERVTYFELSEEHTNKTENHGHIICDTCGKIECVDSLDSKLPRSVKGYKVRSMEVNYHGICKECQ